MVLEAHSNTIHKMKDTWNGSLQNDSNLVARVLNMTVAYILTLATFMELLRNDD